MKYLSFLIFQLFACWAILHALLSSADFVFRLLFFFSSKIKSSGIPLKCQTVCPQIRHNNMFDNKDTNMASNMDHGACQKL